MADVLQGTTPSLRIKIKPTDFTVDVVTALELKFWQADDVTVHDLNDVSLDVENNAFLYHFTEIETLALDPKKTMKYQARFWMPDGNIVGFKERAIGVAELKQGGGD